MTKDPLSDLDSLKVENIFSVKSAAGISRPYLSSDVGWSLYNAIVVGAGFSAFALIIGYLRRRYSIRVIRTTPTPQRRMLLHLMGAIACVMADTTMMRMLSKYSKASRTVIYMG